MVIRILCGEHPGDNISRQDNVTYDIVTYDVGSVIQLFISTEKEFQEWSLAAF